MKLLVCIKNVPDTSEADVSIDKSGKEIATNGLKFDVNETDNYALEEALLLAEQQEGSEVKVVSIAPQDADVTLRMTLAKGSESALRVEDTRINVRNPLQTAKVWAAAAKKDSYDLILTGCMASDDKNMASGVALAEELGMNHASMVKLVELGEGKVTVQRELEGGLLEVCEVALPAVLTIQTGGHTPRYASMRELRKAMKKELAVVGLDDLGLDAAAVSEEGAKIEFLGFSYPVIASNAEMMEGSADEKAAAMALKLMKGGLL